MTLALMPPCERRSITDVGVTLISQSVKVIRLRACS